MKPLIFNSTPLIYQTNIGLSSLFNDMVSDKITTPKVKHEVVEEGKFKGVPDALVLDDLFERSVLGVEELQDDKLFTRLSKTKGQKPRVFISFVSTATILIKAIMQNLISKDRAKEALNEMIGVGWRCSIETYEKIKEIIDQIE